MKNTLDEISGMLDIEQMRLFEDIAIEINQE